jgi:hypothetical protein
MKKLFSIVALLALVAAFAVGCKQEEKPAPPAETPAAPTNAPAAP